MISWVTVVWSVIAAACLTLSGVHLLVWVRDRALLAHLLFALLALSLAVFAGIELVLMREDSLAGYVALHRWGHVTIFFVVSLMAGFVHCHFGTGRSWLLWTIVALRALAVVLTFFPGPTFNYRTIIGLEKVGFLGEEVAVLRGVPSPWAALGPASVMLLLAFVLDASVRLWRQGGGEGRLRALSLGGAVLVCAGVSVIYSHFLHSGRIEGPYLISLSFLVIVIAMGQELSRDTVRAARLARELRESNENMQLAARATGLALWHWDIPADRIWVSPEGRRFYGIPEQDNFDLARFLATLVPSDVPATRAAIAAAMAGDGRFHADYRVALPNAAPRWIEARGRVDFDPAGRPVRMHGVSVDITVRRDAEAELQRLRGEVTHAGRVSMLGQLSSALAHELSQPLGAILRNAEAAELILRRSVPDLDELREIVRDIQQDDRRAGAVIDHLRSLLKRRSLELQSVDPRRLVAEVLALVRADAASRQIRIELSLPDALPGIRADQVHLQQVLLNLLVNAMDAIHLGESTDRRVTIAIAPPDNGMLVFRVRDTGPGIPEEVLPRLFEPFFTTKPHGMGMGLPVSRTIAEAHHGTLVVVSTAGNGSEFLLSIPTESPSR